MHWNNRQMYKVGGDSEAQNKSYGVDAQKYADMLIQDIIKAIPSAITSEKSIQDGFLAYTINVENLETLCRANGWLKDEEYQSYMEMVQKEMSEIQNNPNVSQVFKEAQTSRIKFKHLLKIALSSQPVYDDLEF